MQVHVKPVKSHISLVILQTLNQMTPKSDEVKVQAAVQHKTKNRSMEFLPRKSITVIMYPQIYYHTLL